MLVRRENILCRSCIKISGATVSVPLIVSSRRLCQSAPLSKGKTLLTGTATPLYKLPVGLRDQGSPLLPERIFFVVEIIQRRFRNRWRKTSSPSTIPDQSWRLEISAEGRITLLNPVSCNNTVYFKSPVTKQTKKVIPRRRSTSQLSLTLSI